MGLQRRDVTGQRFGRLVAIRSDRRDRHHNRVWLCRCDCGAEIETPVGRLVTGNTQSCGCLRADVMAPHGDTAGGRKSPEHTAWAHMRDRCSNARHPQFKDYGGRGIAVCDRWGDYRNFLADMGRRPSAKHSLDRIDVNGNYEPNNCRWTTKDVQQHNQRAKSNTGHRGVSWNTRDAAFVWSVSRRGQALRGRCKTLPEAVAALDAARAQLYGATA